jgi:hypothetical protein
MDIKDCKKDLEVEIIKDILKYRSVPNILHKSTKGHIEKVIDSEKVLLNVYGDKWHTGI